MNTNDKSTLDEPFDAGTEHEQRSESALPNQQKNTLAQIWETIVRIGLGESALRVGAAIASLALVLLVVWVMRDFYLKGERNKPVESASGQVAATSAAVLPEAAITPDPVALISGITRLADLHTTIPSRPRFTMT